jgi:hypothetical protein
MNSTLKSAEIYNPTTNWSSSASGTVSNSSNVAPSIQRVAAEKKPAKELAKNYTPNGEVNATKIVSIHTDGDGLVIVENEEDYMDKVPASSFSLGVVNEAGVKNGGSRRINNQLPYVGVGWSQGVPCLCRCGSLAEPQGC